MDVTWHLGPRGSATRAHAAPTRRIIHLYFIDILYNMGFQPSVDRKGIQPIRSSGLINSTFFTNLFRVGLKSHTILLIAGHVTQGEALDRRRIGNPHVDRVNTRPPINQSCTCLKGVIITAQILCDVAASHTSIVWTRGPPDWIKHVPY